MAVSSVHHISVVVFNDTEDTVLPVRGWTLPRGIDVQREALSGEVDPRFVYINAIAPTATFRTLAIDDAIGLAGFSGASIADLATGIDLYAQAAASGGIRQSGASHTKYSVTKGLVIPQTLSVSHRGDAELSYLIVMASSDGSTEPVTITGSTALPSGIDDTKRFTLGPITLENISIGQVSQLDMDFGINAVVLSRDSDIYPTFPYIQSREPSIRIQTSDIGLQDSGSIPLAGLPLTHANTDIFLRKRAEHAQFVADGTAEHVKFTTAGVAHIDPAFDGTGNTPAELTIMITPTDDGTNEPIVPSTGVAIS